MKTTTTLTYDDIVDIVKQLRSCYSLISANWPQLEIVLIELIKKSAVADLGVEPIQEILPELEKNYDKELWKEKIERVFRSCFVLIMSKRSSELLLNSVEELFEEFPDFEEVHDEEKELLLRFRNMMYCGVQLYSAKSNKGKLMDLAGRLSGKVYTTGGGSTIEAQRRELIYEQLGGVTKKKLLVPRKKRVKTEESESVTHITRRAKKLAQENAKKTMHRNKRTKREGNNSEDGTLALGSTSSSSSFAGNDMISPAFQDPDLLMLEPLPHDSSVSTAWFDIISPLHFKHERVCELETPPDSLLTLSSGEESPYAGDGEWGLSMASTIPTLATGTSSFGSPLPTVPQLRRSITIDFSKPIFTEDSFVDTSYLY